MASLVPSLPYDGATTQRRSSSITNMNPSLFIKQESQDFIELTTTQRLSLTSMSSMPNAWDFPDMMMEVEGFNQTNIPSTLPSKDKTLFEGLRDARRSFADTIETTEGMDFIQQDDVADGPMRKRPAPHHHGRDLSLTSLGSLDLDVPLPPMLLTTPETKMEEEVVYDDDVAATGLSHDSEAARLAEERLKREYELALAERLSVFDNVVIPDTNPPHHHHSGGAGEEGLIVEEDMMDDLLAPTAEEEEAWMTQQQAEQQPTLGRFTAEERAVRLAAFRDSRKKRVFNQVKYSMRQQACETRMREKSGRFTSKAAAAALLAEQQQQQSQDFVKGIPQNTFDEDVAQQPPTKKQRRESVANLARMFVRRLSVSLFGSPGSNNGTPTKVPRRHTVMTLAHARELLEEDKLEKEMEVVGVDASVAVDATIPGGKSEISASSPGKKAMRRSTMPPSSGSSRRRISWFFGGSSSTMVDGGNETTNVKQTPFSTPTSPAGGNENLSSPTFPVA